MLSLALLISRNERGLVTDKLSASLFAGSAYLSRVRERSIGMTDIRLIDERQLIADYLRGDSGAFRTVGEWIDTALKGGFFSLRQDWDDVRQEVQARLLQNLKLDRFDGRSTLRTYVMRITRNVCVDATRRSSRRRERCLVPADLAMTPEGSGEPAPDPLARDVVLKIMTALSEGERLLIEMIFGENCSYSEAAQRLGIKEGAVKTRVFRCKNRIVKRYQRLTRGRR